VDFELPARADQQDQGVHSRSLLPPALLVVGLSLLAAWMLRTLAPPSLLRDGKRLPVGLASQGGAGHHAVDGTAPSSVADAPLPHFLGGAFLAVHLLAIVLAAGIPVLRLVRRKFVAQLGFALLAAMATGLSVVLAARFGYGDRLAFRDALTGGVDVARYAFVLAIAVVVLFGLPGNPQVRSRG
jgi:hypothetical protein